VGLEVRWRVRQCSCSVLRQPLQRVCAALPSASITNIEGELLGNGLGTRAIVQVAQASASGFGTPLVFATAKTGIRATWLAHSSALGSATSTDRDIVNGLLARVHAQVNDATTRQILDTSVISGSTRAIFTGSAQTVGKQTFKATTLQSAIDPGNGRVRRTRRSSVPLLGG